MRRTNGQNFGTFKHGMPLNGIFNAYHKFITLLRKPFDQTFTFSGNWNYNNTDNVCNNDACSPNHCCSGKAIRIKYSESVSVALGIQHAMRMRRIILKSAACPVVRYCLISFYMKTM